MNPLISRVNLNLKNNEMLRFLVSCSRQKTRQKVLVWFCILSSSVCPNSVCVCVCVCVCVRTCPAGLVCLLCLCLLLFTPEGNMERLQSEH